MSKKYFLLVILVVIAGLAISAFVMYSNKAVSNKAASNVKVGFRTPLTSNFVPFNRRVRVGFQTPLNSGFAPSNSQAGFQTPPTSNYSLSRDGAGFQTPPTSNYAPSISIEALRRLPRQ